MPNAAEGVNKRKAPDGGWGWFVCLGSSLISLSLRSLDPSFGLLFQDLLEDLDADSTSTALIIGVLDAIVNLSGLVVGPLLKKYSYRQVALFGSLLSCTGLMLTSRANSVIHILCTYSVLGGLGTGLAIASSFVALNVFFDKKRGQAVGFSMAGTTLAMMLVPQLIHVLLESYGFRGTMLIIGGWAMHSVVGACLLRPLEVDNEESVKKEAVEKPTETDALLNKSANELRNDKGNSIELTKSDVLKETPVVEEKETKKDRSYLQKVKDTFDLDLLKDPIYVNVIIGLSLYYVGESNFKLMTPFLLADIGMTKAEIASCLSVTAFTDILARITLPTVFDKLRIKKRFVFWIAGLLVGIGRSVLAEQSKGLSLIITLVVIGFLRGATIVNLNLSVSECCSLKKLPSAFGMFMVAKGILVVTVSPLIGHIRDVSGSYAVCIHVLTAMMVVTFVTWSIEFSFRGMRNRRARLAKEAEANAIE